jgi:hypothetical protein
MSTLKTRHELDVHTIEEIRQLIGPILNDVCQRHFDDSTGYAQELAADIESRLISDVQVASSRGDKVTGLKGGGAVYTAGQIKAVLADVPDDRFVLSQIVGSQTGVYNAYFEIGVLKNGNGPVVISAGHPELAHLPMCLDNDDRNRKINELIANLNALR